MILFHRIQCGIVYVVFVIYLFISVGYVNFSYAAEDIGTMPVLSDPNERLSKPDLSSLTRFRFLTTSDFPPFNFVDQTGRLSGYHVDVIREVCRELGIEAKCQIQAMPYADLEPALEAGNGEAIMAGIATSPGLRQKFAFSKPYMLLPARFAVLGKLGLSGRAANALSGRRVGVIADTAHQKMLAAFFPKLVAVPMSGQEELFTSLKEGKVDAVFADAVRVPFWVASPAAEKCCVLLDGPYVSERFLGEGFSIMLRKGGLVPLTAAVDYALAQLAAKGRLQDIYLRYFPNGFY